MKILIVLITILTSNFKYEISKGEDHLLITEVDNLLTTEGDNFLITEVDNLLTTEVDLEILTQLPTVTTDNKIKRKEI
jgi:hypothetical protein